MTATHVFTTHQSYYSPLTGGIVDFQIGQEVDPEEVILDDAVRQGYLDSGALVPLDQSPFQRRDQAPMTARTELAEPPLLADPSAMTDTPAADAPPVSDPAPGAAPDQTLGAERQKSKSAGGRRPFPLPADRAPSDDKADAG